METRRERAHESLSYQVKHLRIREPVESKHHQVFLPEIAGKNEHTCHFKQHDDEEANTTHVPILVKGGDRLLEDRFVPTAEANRDMFVVCSLAVLSIRVSAWFLYLPFGASGVKISFAFQKVSNFEFRTPSQRSVCSFCDSLKHAAK